MGAKAKFQVCRENEDPAVAGHGQPFSDDEELYVECSPWSSPGCRLFVRCFNWDRLPDHKFRCCVWPRNDATSSGRAPFSVAVESDRTTFRTPSRDACKLNRRVIVNGQRLSFPTQLMKRTTCQPHDCTARTVLGDAEHQVRASPGKCVAASIHRAGGQWDEIGEKCRDGRCERPRLTTAPRSPNAFTGTRRVCQYVTE